MGNLEEFNKLTGFKFLEAYGQEEICSDGTTTEVITLRFCNDKHVGIDLDLIDGELHILDPYEINGDYEAVDK